MPKLILATALIGVLVLEAAVYESGSCSSGHDRIEAFDEDAMTLSPYFVVAGGDSDDELLPLESTKVDVNGGGIVADVTVTQIYRNPGSHADRGDLHLPRIDPCRGPRNADDDRRACGRGRHPGKEGGMIGIAYRPSTWENGI